MPLESGVRVVGVNGERSLLLDHLYAEREHVLAAVEGLSEDNLSCPGVPSGWSISQLLNHLTYDNEIFWIGAIVDGGGECIDLVQDGWKAPATSGAEAVAQYRRWCGHSDAVLAAVDLDVPPRWWPSEVSFPFPPFRDARSCVLRVLVETATHAGHLDIVREQMDGRQYLVVE